jgi:hypothetical protein
MYNFMFYSDAYNMVPTRWEKNGYLWIPKCWNWKIKEQYGCVYWRVESIK